MGNSVVCCVPADNKKTSPRFAANSRERRGTDRRNK